MKHAFLILTHFPPQHIYTQVLRLQGHGHSFFIHFDAKLPTDDRDPEWIKLAALPGVTILPTRVKVQWASFHIIDATLALIDTALKTGAPDYLHLMSGECQMVKPMGYFHNFFASKPGTEYMEHFLMQEKGSHLSYARLDKYHLHDLYDMRSAKIKDVSLKYLNIVLRKTQSLLKKAGIYRRYSNPLPPVYAGSQWWSLTGAACRYIMQYVAAHPAYYRRMHYTHVPDEMFFHTLLMNSPFKDKVNESSLRYIHFSPNNSSPQPLTLPDLSAISAPGILFARKFTPASKELLEQLDRTNAHK